jgi:nucleoside-diphosphate-sugar epimerase
MSKSILVSGASVYIASHIIKELLTRGYKVIGTVRSLANKEKYQFLYLFDHSKENLELG